MVNVSDEKRPKKKKVNVKVKWCCIFSVFLANLSNKRESFPSEVDAKGSAVAIMRLQDTYKLDTHDIAQGVVKGLKESWWYKFFLSVCYFTFVARVCFFK